MSVETDANGRMIVRPRPRRRKPPMPVHDAGPSKAPEPTPPREDVGESAALVDARGPIQSWQCGAKLRGEREGLRCRMPKISGGKRCRMHGNASRAAKEKARERILMSSDHAAKKLISFLNDPAAPYSVKLAAARDLLDRADLSGTSKVEVEMPGFVQTLETAVGIRRLSADDSQDRTSVAESQAEVIDAEVVEKQPPAIAAKPPRRTPASQPEDNTLNGPRRVSHTFDDLWADEPPEGTGRRENRRSRPRGSEMRR